MASRSFASPAQGLYTAIVGGFLVSALGGSRFQIGGPAGTFVKFIPYPVTVGSTSGIAVIIFASQLKELFGPALR